MQHIFGEHIGPTVEAYVDEIVVKTKRVSNLINDLNVAFKCLRAKNIKLNPEKCVFGVPRGMLLGFIISELGIKANPEKIAAISTRARPEASMVEGYLTKEAIESGGPFCNRVLKD
jgi:hypothetical protein